MLTNINMMSKIINIKQRVATKSNRWQQIATYHKGGKMQTETQSTKPTNERKFIRLPNELAERVRALAQQENRNLSNMAQVLIAEALTARGNP